MAIMWDATTVRTLAALTSPAAMAWRLRLAQALVASGYEPAVVKEALFPNEPGGDDPPPDPPELSDVA